MTKHTYIYNRKHWNKNVAVASSGTKKAIKIYNTNKKGENVQRDPPLFPKLGIPEQASKF